MNRARILIVDDLPEKLLVYSSLLEDIDAGRTTEVDVIAAIRTMWREFALNEPSEGAAGRIAIVFEKQNSTLFWSAQRRWSRLLREQLGIGGAATSSAQ